MYPITRNASPAVIDAVRERGCLKAAEIPPLDSATVDGLVAWVLSAVDQDAARGAIM